MKCTHKTTRKLFWLNQQRGKWETTNFSICLDCKMAIGMQPLELESKDKKPTLPEKTKDALNVKRDVQT